MNRATAPFASLLLFALLVSCASAPPRAEPRPKTVVHEIDACPFFHPVYLTAQEVQALSRTTLGAIVANNDEGMRRCGWKPLAPGAH